jgi:hypothetical protein
MRRLIIFLIASVLSLHPLAAACDQGGFLGCADMGFVNYCVDYGGDSRVFYWGQNPSGVSNLQGACVFCSAGCALCTSVVLAVETDCGTFYGTLCCRTFLCCT